MKSDLINRQAAIDTIEKHLNGVFDGTHYDEGIAYGYEAAHRHIQDVINALPSAQQWTPISERLPEANEKDENDFIKAYLVQDARWMDVARWDGEYWIAWGYGTVLKDVIAWMPLPKPYREEDANDKDYSSHQKLC